MVQDGPPLIFSRRKAAAKWARSRTRLRNEESARYLIDTLVDDMIDRLEFIRLEPKQALVVGDASKRLPRWLLNRGCESKIGRLGVFDEERPGETGGFDLIVHLLGLGHVNDLPGALIHARSALHDEGLFIAAFPGAGSLPTLRQVALAADGERAAARMHPLVDNRAGAGLLQRAGFRKQVVDTFEVKLRFSELEKLVSDLRDNGLTSSLAADSPPWTKEGLARARAKFDELRDEDGKVSESLEILVLSGWR